MILSTCLGVVLAGGSSSRMGTDKPILEVHGGRLVDRAAERLAEAGLEVVVADRGRGLISGLPSVPDGEGGGPAAGLLGVADAFPGRALVVLACDLPNVPAQLLAALYERPADADWTVPRHAGGLETLCARYGERTLETLRRRVREGNHALHRLTNEEGLRIDYIEEEELAKFGAVDVLFRNLNSPEDLERVRSRTP